MEKITEAAHQMCAALHENLIDPEDIEVHLPRPVWWKLYLRLDQMYQGFMKFDGRGPQPLQFQFKGIVFKPK